jgi:hypothetical protein
MVENIKLETGYEDMSIPSSHEIAPHSHSGCPATRSCSTGGGALSKNDPEIMLVSLLLATQNRHLALPQYLPV